MFVFKLLFGDLDDAQPVLGLHPQQQFVASLLVAAEAVVVADHERGDAGPENQHPDELLGRREAEGPVERDDEEVVDAELFEQAALLLGRGEQLQIGLFLQQQAGMGRKGDDQALAAAAPGLVDHLPEQHPVAAVHPVVGADGRRDVSGRGECVETTEDPHGRQELPLPSSPSLTK